MEALIKVCPDQKENENVKFVLGKAEEKGWNFKNAFEFYSQSLQANPDFANCNLARGKLGLFIAKGLFEKERNGSYYSEMEGMEGLVSTFP